jgi:hypothetical protein
MSFANCDQAQFNVRNYDTRGNPTTVAVGDLNGDSNVDFIIPEEGANKVWIFYGDGTGRFLEPRQMKVLIFPQSLLVGDFNNDGFGDLVILGADDIEVLLGHGDGTFAPPALYPVTGTQVVAGDFNQDGNLDLAVNATGITVFLGTGTGAFGTPIKSTGFPAVEMATGDFDEDGFPDIATSDATGHTVRVTHADGMGHFTVAQTYSLDGDGNSLTAADFNNDGHEDLAAGSSNILPDNNVRIFFGRGNGSFTPGERVPSIDPAAIAVADLNNDGNADLVVANSGFGTVTFSLGDGTGGFSNLIHVDLPGSRPNPLDLATADFNGDGRADVVTANFRSGGGTVFASAPCDQ